MKEIEILQQYIDESDNIVFFGGAGVSTESGIPDFRSKDGLYNQKYAYPPEEILSSHFFYSQPAEFFRFYKDKMLVLYAKPNRAHLYLAKLEKEGKLQAIVTQNIDGLHQKAGNKNVIELHGSIYRNRCINCSKFYPPEYIKECDKIPYCEHCHNIVKPEVVLYEEPLDEMVMTKAMIKIMEAELLIIAGTSLSVYPANGFINYFQGKHMVLINKDKTPYDNKADLVIHDKIGEVFSKLK